MASVTFSTNRGGDGLVVTDDNDPSTGLGNGGHRLRFVPSLANVVNVASYTLGRADAAEVSAGNSLNSSLSSMFYATSATQQANAAANSRDLASSYAQTALTRQTEASNSAGAASSYASSANASLLALSDVLSNGIGAFSVDANGDLSVSYNEPTVTNLTIDAAGELIVTY